MEDLILTGPAMAAKGKSVSLTAEIWPENTTNKKSEEIFVTRQKPIFLNTQSTFTVY